MKERWYSWDKKKNEETNRSRYSPTSSFLKFIKTLKLFIICF